MKSLKTRYLVRLAMGPIEDVREVSFENAASMSSVIAAAREATLLGRRADVLGVEEVEDLFGETVMRTVYIPHDAINGGGTISGSVDRAILTQLKSMGGRK